MRQFEQGTLDSLCAARAAVDRAIAAYEAAPKGLDLTLDEGPLFAMIDNVNTAQAELADAISITIRE